MFDLQGYFVLGLVYLVGFVSVRALLNRARTRPRLPPGPPALPIIGHIHLLGNSPRQTLHKLSLRYGPLIHISFGSFPCVVASSAETAKQCLKFNDVSFSNRPRIAFLDYLTYGGQNFSFAPYGPYWAFMKKLCVSELLGAKTLDLLAPIRHEEIKWFIDSMLEKAEAIEEVDVGRQILRLTNNIISRMTMSRRCSGESSQADEVRKLIKEMAQLTSKFNPSDLFRFLKGVNVRGSGKQLKDVRDRFDALMEGIITEHEVARRKRKEDGGNAAERSDLLDILLDVYEDEGSEMKLTRENIKAFILDVFAGGSDTSAMTLEWALAELINHAEVTEKARREIDSVVGTNRTVRESDIRNLPYIQAIVKETLRLHPSAAPMISRESSEDCTIGGYHIPANTRLLVHVWAIGRDPKYWEHPLEFNPERFLSGNSKMIDLKGQHFELLPFGSGRRMCPGRSLALRVVETCLAAMIQCFDWKPSPNNNGKVNMEEGSGLLLSRAHPLICVPVARLDPFPKP